MIHHGENEVGLSHLAVRLILKGNLGIIKLNSGLYFHGRIEMRPNIRPENVFG